MLCNEDVFLKSSYSQFTITASSSDVEAVDSALVLTDHCTLRQCSHPSTPTLETLKKVKPQPRELKQLTVPYDAIWPLT